MPENKMTIQDMLDMELNDSKSIGNDRIIVRVPGGWNYEVYEEPALASSFVPEPYQHEPTTALQMIRDIANKELVPGLRRTYVEEKETATQYSLQIIVSDKTDDGNILRTTHKQGHVSHLPITLTDKENCAKRMLSDLINGGVSNSFGWLIKQEKDGDV